jgi:hypothetical protein
MKTFKSLLLVCAFSLLIALFCVSAVAQIEIPQAQLTSSFSYLNTAKGAINQRGFELSSGWNWTRWLTLGADFCHYAGGGNAYQDIVVPGLGDIGSHHVPLNFNTYTVAVGTKFLLRKNKYVVPFVRPGLGLVHESYVTEQPTLPGFPSQVAAGIAAQGGSKGEYRMFYGVGGGFEIMNVVPHASIIMLSDYLRTRLFAEDLNSYRISAGLSWHFGSKTVK